jgi:hypothetical protein
VSLRRDLAVEALLQPRHERHVGVGERECRRQRRPVDKGGLDAVRREAAAEWVLRAFGAIAG